MDIDGARTIPPLERGPARAPDPSLELGAAAREHAHRGLRLQVLLRGALAAFVVLVVAIVPPLDHDTASHVIAAAYAVWAIAVGAWSWRGGEVSLRFGWVALFVDLLALAILTLLAGGSAEESWTSSVLVNGFFLVPLLAATQLRPDVCAAVVVPTIVIYVVSSVLTRTANEEPWDSLLLRTLVLIGVGGACVALSWIQRTRVAAISGLVRDRTELLDELVGTEDRERRALAEHLHDGALQYVLAARHDLEDAREAADPTAFTRLERALSESSRLLRSTVAELHPAVLEQAGLARALRELADNAQATGGLSVTLDLGGWSPGLRTTTDRLLYATARELLANVVKHARARSTRVTLAHHEGRAVLTIADDGCGIPDGALEASLREGHIGLASHRVRVEAAGGRLVIGSAQPSGTVARVELPAEPTAAPAGSP